MKLRLHTFLVAALAAGAAQAQWSTNCWPAPEKPRMVYARVIQAWSAAVERCDAVYVSRPPRSLWKSGDYWLRRERWELNNIKGAMSSVRAKYICPTNAVGGKFDAYLIAHHPTNLFWKSDADLCAASGAPTNWLDTMATEYRMLHSSTNGWKWAPSIFSNLIWTAEAADGLLEHSGRYAGSSRLEFPEDMVWPDVLAHAQTNAYDGWAAGNYPTYPLLTPFDGAWCHGEQLSSARYGASYERLYYDWWMPRTNCIPATDEFYAKVYPIWSLSNTNGYTLGVSWIDTFDDNGDGLSTNFTRYTTWAESTAARTGTVGDVSKLSVLPNDAAQPPLTITFDNGQSTRGWVIDPWEDWSPFFVFKFDGANGFKFK